MFLESGDHLVYHCQRCGWFTAIDTDDLALRQTAEMVIAAHRLDHAYGLQRQPVRSGGSLPTPEDAIATAEQIIRERRTRL